MRKPRDYESELKALEQKARQLKSRRQSQLGELVIACGADALTSEELAGALIAAVGIVARIAATPIVSRRSCWPRYRSSSVIANG